MTKVRTIIEDAFRAAGVVAHDEPMTADYAAHGLRMLQRMLKGWQNYGFNLWVMDTVTVTLTSATAAYTLTARPQRVHSVRYKVSGIETPMQELTKGEYDNLPDKAAAGTPTGYWFDKKLSTGVLTVWPVLATAAGETLRVSVERVVEDYDNLSDDADFPVEWESAAVYNLADELMIPYAVADPMVLARIPAKAAETLSLALAADREGSVFFYETAPW